MDTINKIETGVVEELTTLITGYRHTPNKNNKYFCTNDNRELFFVDTLLMLSLPFYIKADKVYYNRVDDNGEETEERFYRYEATSSYKAELESHQ